MEVNVTSTETIKPSSPTPSHLRTFKLSLLDHLSPHMYMSGVTFYTRTYDNINVHAEKTLAELKASFSKALTRFYPLAGRIKDQFSVDCNDEGVLYMESQVNIKMLDFLKQPKLELLNNLVPMFPSNGEQPLNLLPQLAIKVNLFSCGGIAIGIRFLHILIDGYTITSLIREWAALKKGTSNKKIVAYPHNQAASMFPINQASLSYVTIHTEGPLAREGNIITSRLVFNGEALDVLKAKARSIKVPKPTRTEVITALLWRSSLNAYRLSSACNRRSGMGHLINLRTRLNPPLPDHSIGNMLWAPVAFYEPKTSTHDIEADVELPYLVELLRKSIAHIDNAFAQRLQGEQGHLEMAKSLEESRGMFMKDGEIPMPLCANSLVSLGFYDEVDFGWGKPTWIALAGFADPLPTNFFVLMDAPMGEGIEAWVFLQEREMAFLEKDVELLSFASLNPGIEPKQAPAIPKQAHNLISKI